MWSIEGRNDLFPDIDECSKSSLNMCGAHSECKNMPGTYKCECEKGFRGDGMMCTGKVV